MDDARCKAFLASVDTGSFSAAARKLGYTSSGVIRLVNALESELGMQLLERTHQGVTPSVEGELLLSAMRQLDTCNDTVRELAASIQGSEVGTVRIGTKLTAVVSVLPALLSSFFEQYPRVHVELREGGNAELSQWLRERTIDCCFTNEPEPGCEWVPFESGCLVAWLPGEHPFAKRKRLALQDLENEPFIKTQQKHVFTDRVLADAGFMAPARFTVSDYQTVFEMVAAGLGVAICSEAVTRSFAGNVAVVPLKPEIYLPIGLAYPAHTVFAPAVQHFIDHVHASALKFASK